MLSKFPGSVHMESRVFSYIHCPDLAPVREECPQHQKPASGTSPAAFCLSRFTMHDPLAVCRF